MKKLVVIGGGPGGNAAALTAARHGADGVVLVEKESMGGTCTNRGCIPTKFLLSRLTEPDTQQGSGGWKRLVAHKNALVRGLSSSIERSLVDAGVEVVKGHGRLAGAHSVDVTTAGGERVRLEGETIVLASGSAPAEIAGVRLDGEKVLSSTEALDLPVPPQSMIIIGSGAVGSEFSFIFQRAGTKVTVVEAMDRLFPGEDAEVHRLFSELYGRMGVDHVTGDPVERAEPGRGGEMRVFLESGAVLEAEKVLLATGRRLCSDDVGLEEAGLSAGPGGALAVDEDLRTALPHILAVGDVTGRLLLAHLASFQGVHAGRRAAGLSARRIPYHAVPWSIFTTPEIATVGVNESEAQRRSLDVCAAHIPWMDNIKARIDRRTEGFVKLVADREGRILGGTVVGEHASDMIHIISALVHRGSTLKDVTGMVFAHPGLAETLYEVAQKLAHRLRAGTSRG